MRSAKSLTAQPADLIRKTPERDLLARIEVELLEIQNQVDGMDKRMDFLAERQEFTESLIDQKRRMTLPADASGQGDAS